MWFALASGSWGKGHYSSSEQTLWDATCVPASLPVALPSRKYNTGQGILHTDPQSEAELSQRCYGPLVDPKGRNMGLLLEASELLLFFWGVCVLLLQPSLWCEWVLQRQNKHPEECVPPSVFCFFILLRLIEAQSPRVLVIGDAEFLEYSVPTGHWMTGKILRVSGIYLTCGNFFPTSDFKLLC